MTVLWLRAETKPNEKRTALTPTGAAKLIEKGFKIVLEISDASIFHPDSYPTAVIRGKPGSWATAPPGVIILGLKELPESDAPLTHDHVFFGHCFKGQDGWMQLLDRFHRGNGRLLDLEFLHNENGRRVAAFGYYAGFAGAALGLRIWAEKELKQKYSKIVPFDNAQKLISSIKLQLDQVKESNGKSPNMMVMGALGRCGRGAMDLGKAVGLDDSMMTGWDMQETAAGGPFDEILDHDIFVNCIYLSSPIPPFVTKDSLKGRGADRKLSVLVDVSCDPNNPNNPVPIYSLCTTFDDPTVVVDVNKGPPLDIIAIDHLPTLLPREASESFCNDLLPYLETLDKWREDPVWKRADDLFQQKVLESKKI